MSDPMRRELAKQLVDKTRRIGAEVAGPVAAEVDRDARFPREAIEALRKDRLLGACVPESLGGMGCDVSEAATMCQSLGQHCASSAMVLAMHHIQVASIARHGLSSSYFRGYLSELAQRQNLIASVTSEVGVGGDLRSSVCAVEPQGTAFALKKEAPTVSYGEHADELLVTSRRAPDAASNDQVLVLLRRPDYALERTGSWDTLGMRGTCSPGFRLAATLSREQIVPAPFPDIASQTMVPYSHILWSACWLGIATDAVARARAFVRGEARRRPGVAPPGSLRLAEVASVLQLMRTNIYDVARHCDELMGGAEGGEESMSTMAFAIKMNNLKIASSQLVVQIVSQALTICGMAGYKTDSKFSLGRHLRDAYSAALMINNDRIYGTNASLLLVLKDE